MLLISCTSSLISTTKHCDFYCFRKGRVEQKLKYKTKLNLINFWETYLEFLLDISSYPFSVEQSGVRNLFLIGACLRGREDFFTLILFSAF